VEDLVIFLMRDKGAIKRGVREKDFFIINNGLKG
jgi:hypothetical protein